MLPGSLILGKIKRAPPWMQRAGFEWAYRLSQEPRRLWRRYLVEDMAFLWLIVREWMETRRQSNE